MIQNGPKEVRQFIFKNLFQINKKTQWPKHSAWNRLQTGRIQEMI